MTNGNFEETMTESYSVILEFFDEWFFTYSSTAIANNKLNDMCAGLIFSNDSNIGFVFVPTEIVVVFLKFTKLIRSSII